jgi:hypothetical protein
MSTLLIYGASDDLVEVEGDIRTEGYTPDGSTSIIINDTILGHFIYSTDGCWHFSPHPTFSENVNTFTLHLTPALGEEAGLHPETDIPGYSDFLTLHGTIINVRIGDDDTIVL